MSKFITVKLNELAAPGRSVISGPFGSNIGQRFFKTHGVPIIRGNNLTTDFKKFNDDGFVFLTEEKADELKSDAIKGDILFTAAGTIGQVGMIPQSAKYDRYVISNKQLRFRVDPEKADPDYVYYWLASPWIYKTIIDRNTGSTVPLINLGIIKSLPVSLPKDIIEQKKIASVLAKIDEKIALNNRINTELEAMAKTLYDYWFVQFDFPDDNGKPYKTSGGKMEYNATLKREIPVGWKIKKISEIALVKAGGDKPSNCVNFRSDEYSTPIFSNGISSEGLYGYTDIAVVNKPSITVSARGTIGYSVLRLKPFFPIIRLLVLTPYQDNALKFLEETIKRFSFENSGSVQQQLTVPQISEMSVLYPIEQLLNIYTKRIWPLIKKMELIKEQNSELQ